MQQESGGGLAIWVELVDDPLRDRLDKLVVAATHDLDIYWFGVMITSGIQLARSLAQDFPLGTLSS